jgi:hypothetical protein
MHVSVQIAVVVLVLGVLGPFILAFPSLRFSCFVFTTFSIGLGALSINRVAPGTAMVITNLVTGKRDVVTQGLYFFLPVWVKESFAWTIREDIRGVKTTHTLTGTRIPLRTQTFDTPAVKCTFKSGDEATIDPWVTWCIIDPEKSIQTRDLTLFIERKIDAALVVAASKVDSVAIISDRSLLLTEFKAQVAHTAKFLLEETGVKLQEVQIQGVVMNSMLQKISNEAVITTAENHRLATQAAANHARARADLEATRELNEQDVKNGHILLAGQLHAKKLQQESERDNTLQLAKAANAQSKADAVVAHEIQRETIRIEAERIESMAAAKLRIRIDELNAFNTAGFSPEQASDCIRQRTMAKALSRATSVVIKPDVFGIAIGDNLK